MEPTEQLVPAGQMMQSVVRLERKPTFARTVWLACVPPGHGCGAELPSTHRYPGVHSRQAVLPEVGENLPASHRSQVDCPGLAETAPGRHGRHAASLVLPGTGLALPAGHATHASALEAPRVGLKVPAEHCR